MVSTGRRPRQERRTTPSNHHLVRRRLVLASVVPVSAALLATSALGAGNGAGNGVPAQQTRALQIVPPGESGFFSLEGQAQGTADRRPRRLRRARRRPARRLLGLPLPARAVLEGRRAGGAEARRADLPRRPRHPGGLRRHGARRVVGRRLRRGSGPAVRDRRDPAAGGGPPGRAAPGRARCRPTCRRACSPTPTRSTPPSSPAPAGEQGRGRGLRGGAERLARPGARRPRGAAAGGVRAAVVGARGVHGEGRPRIRCVHDALRRLAGRRRDGQRDGPAGAPRPLGDTGGRAAFDDLFWRDDRRRPRRSPRRRGRSATTTRRRDSAPVTRAVERWALRLPAGLAAGPGTGAYPSRRGRPAAGGSARRLDARSTR